MKKIVLLTAALLVSGAAMAGNSDQRIYREHAPTVESAQVIVDAIHNGDIRVCTRPTVYDVRIPDSPTTTRVNRFGEIEVVPSKTIFKVSCENSGGSR